MIGDKLAARKFRHQKTETVIGFKMPEFMLQPTKPKPVKVTD